MMQKKPSAAYKKAKAHAVAFDASREALAAACQLDRDAGMVLREIAEKLNAQGVRTKTGLAYSHASVCSLIKFPKPPTPRKSEAALRREKRAKRTYGAGRTGDLNLGWASAKHPHLKQWIALGAQWLSGREGGLAASLKGVSVFIDFLAKHRLSADPAEFLFHKTVVPDLYNSTWGKVRTAGKVLFHNHVHFFLEWVLSQPQFREEDDEGVLRTSPAFRNPIPRLSRSGIPVPMESVRSTLPYGYIEELRQMIAQGPTFRDWTWAQKQQGLLATKVGHSAAWKDLQADDGVDEEGHMVAPIWYQVERRDIDEDDPDCVWRTRTRLIPSEPGRKGGHKKSETIFEMWSPGRWVAVLVKLQLPLRGMQVRVLDSGEADTFKWADGEWSLNTNRLARGTETQPYTNGVFLKPNQLADQPVKVLLHINTNKTADIGKAGNQKGYNVPWVVGGPLHQDPFYWLEKLRRWQEKYNPLKRLTMWKHLDNRHIPQKTFSQLAEYPDTAFLFRTPEDQKNPDFPITMGALGPPWLACLTELERRLFARGELLPRGGRIRLTIEREQQGRTKSYGLFSLHCLRVSLLTALALDGEVPLAILQKIAGHSRMIMLLYYLKPGAVQTQEAIQAGVRRLNESAAETIVDWLANTEFKQLVKEVIANSIESFKAAVPELIDLRTPAGWMPMVDGLCLVGGNNTELDAPGCHNGGPNIGNDTSPKYASVPGGSRNCPRCRWFITRPYYLPMLVARWNNAMYHCDEAQDQVVIAEERFRAQEDRRAATMSAGAPFANQREYLEAQRFREQSIKKFEDLLMNVVAITKLTEPCRRALHQGDGTAIIAVGGMSEFELSIEEVSSELLQLSGVCEGSEFYPDLDPGKAVLRQSQLLDAALLRDRMPPVFLTLSESEQILVGNAFMRQLGAQMNPQNPSLGRYQIISLIDAGESLRQRLGPVVDDVLKRVTSEMVPRRVIPIVSLPYTAGTI